MRVLVCGGRDYDDVAQVRLYLNFLRSVDTVIHGAARGADRLAGQVALTHGCAVEEYPADWSGRGKMAGMERNRIMLNTKPDLVVAFPGGTGTANMVSIAREAGVRVRLVP